MYGIRLFEELCVGCRCCMVACQASKGLAMDVIPLLLHEEEEDRDGSLRLTFSALACRHCSDAPCAASCPSGAMARSAQGLVQLDEKACINCGACVEACPFAAVSLDRDLKRAVKCDLCSGRAKHGLPPSCVSACPGKAIYAGKILEIEAAIETRRSAMRASRARVQEEAGARFTDIY